jgi:hypothetical protein
MLEPGEDESVELRCHGAPNRWSASPFGVRTLADARQPYDQVGFFRCVFPLPWFADHAGSLPEVMLEICRKLKPVSGYGGIGIIAAPDLAAYQRHEHVVYELAQRFPGLEVDEPTCTTLSLRGWMGGKAGIKGVNWLTVVGDRWLPELGGVDAVQADLAVLDPRFFVHRFGGGVMIQAGDHPELGDAQRNLWPELYVKLAKYLKPIRIMKHRRLHDTGIEQSFDPERTNAWLRRFDDR